MGDAGEEPSDGNGDKTNDGERFDRLPATVAEREVDDRPTRREVLDWWDERFGIPPEVFADYSFWERGSGKIWAFYGEVDSPVAIEGLGMLAVRTRQEHWKPTLDAVQRFGAHASKNVVHLTREQAADFLAGRDQDVDWDGDWGFLVVTHDLAGEPEPLGVGLYVYDELRSQVPKGRRQDL